MVLSPGLVSFLAKFTEIYTSHISYKSVYLVECDVRYLCVRISLYCESGTRCSQVPLTDNKCNCGLHERCYLKSFQVAAVAHPIRVAQFGMLFANVEVPYWITPALVDYSSFVHNLKKKRDGTCIVFLFSDAYALCLAPVSPLSDCRQSAYWSIWL